jgi:hypothetical protein
MYITITKEDVESMTGLVPNDVELDDIVVRLEADYRDQLLASSLAIIAGEIIGQDVSQARQILQKAGVEDFEEALFVATYEDIVEVIADEIGALPEQHAEAIIAAVDWQELVSDAVMAVQFFSLYDLIADVVRLRLYQVEDELVGGR